MGTEDQNEFIEAFISNGSYVQVAKSTIEPLEETRGTAHLMYTDAFPHRVYCSSCHKMIIPNMEWIGVYGLTFNYCPCCGERFVDNEGGD